MAKRSGLGMEFYVGGFDLSGDTAALDTIAGPRTTFDVTAINKSAMERLHGLGNGQIDWTTFFNDASGQEHLALRGLVRIDINILALVGTTVGDPAAFLVAKQIDYPGSRGADGSFTLAPASLANAVPLEWGTLLLPKTTVSGAGNSAREAGAASSTGLSAVIHCTAFDGTDYTATIQESSDNGGADAYATLKAFAQITAVNTSERVTVTGAIEAVAARRSGSR